MILRRFVAAVGVMVMVGGCAEGPALRGKIRGLTTTVDDAQKNGAMKCAPRELAIARSNLEFAEVDLDQGRLSKAEAHLAKAEPNARAAFQNSPPDRCTSREFVEIETPKDVDTDGDGIFDPKDQCINEPEDKDGYLDDDGCPDPDNDADGIVDTADKCLNEPEDLDGYQDEDGCPDPDNDADKIADLEDHCPNTPGVPGGDHPGCPRKNTLVVITEKEIRITQQIQFEFNRAVIRPGISYKILDEVVQVLNDNPKINLEVQGHTDNVGGDAYNMKLSQSRADAVRAYLAAHGIRPARLILQGLRVPPAAGAQQLGGQPRAQSARAIHSNRGEFSSYVAVGKSRQLRRDLLYARARRRFTERATHLYRCDNAALFGLARPCDCELGLCVCIRGRPKGRKGSAGAPEEGHRGRLSECRLSSGDKEASGGEHEVRRGQMRPRAEGGVAPRPRLHAGVGRPRGRGARKLRPGAGPRRVDRSGPRVQERPARSPMERRQEEERWRRRRGERRERRAAHWGLCAHACGGRTGADPVARVRRVPR